MASGQTLKTTSLVVSLPVLIAIGFGMNSLARGGGETFAVFLLPIEREMGWSRGTLALIYAVYMGVHGLFGPFLGLCVDRWGPAKIYALGLGIFSLSFGVAAFGSEPWHFYLSTGAGAGIAMTCMGMTTASVMISRWHQHHPKRNLSGIVALVYAGLGAGVMIWIPFVQLLIYGFGWRNAYLVLSLVMFIAMLLLPLLPWQRLPKATTKSSLSESLGHMRRASVEPTFWALFSVLFVTALAIYVLVPQMVAFFVASGFSDGVASLAFSANGLLTVFGLAGTGWLAGRFGARNMATISYTMTIIGVGLFAILSMNAWVLLLALSILPFGLSQGARGPIVSALISKHFAGPGLGAIHGFITMGIGFGGMVGAWIGGLLYDATGNYSLNLAFAAAMAALGIAQFWILPVLRREKPKPS